MFCWFCCSLRATMPKLRRTGLFESLAILFLLFRVCTRLTQITRRNDVVAIKNTACLVTADAHGHPLAHASAHHVSHSCPAEIAEDQPLPQE